MIMIRFLSKRTAALVTVALMCLLLMMLPAGGGNLFSAFSPSAEAGFFSNDLELFKEVVDLVGDKYIYPPNYKKVR